MDVGETPGATPFDPERLRGAFDATEPFTIGLEEETMLLDPETLDLCPCAEALLNRLGGDTRFKPELPASQLEVRTDPEPTAEAAIEALAAGRRHLAEAARGVARPAAAGAHPFATGSGELSGSERYERLQAEYGPIARRQLVASLQVHVALGDSRAVLPVYNALRGYLPEIAALAANAPIFQGEDTRMASVRPKVAELLPRQGVPPEIESWSALAEELRWGAAAGTVPEPRLWWWELRPHPGFGTLEVRVPDAQTTIADAAGVAAFVQALVALLAERHCEGDRLPAPPTWRIEENRWSAARHGTDGRMADLGTGASRPTREWLSELVDALSPIARRLGSSEQLAQAARLVEANGAIRQRAVARERGSTGLAGWLADSFVP
jgi:glutamate---cysteine ligase / carboxylate-amine ligase